MRRRFPDITGRVVLFSAANGDQRAGVDYPEAVDHDSLAREFGEPVQSSGPRPGTPMPQALVDGEGRRLPRP